jgi:hypothetical protein
VWFAKTSAEAPNGRVLGGVSLNSMIDSIRRGGNSRARAALYIKDRLKRKSVRTMPLDHNDGADRRVAPVKGSNRKLRSESCRQVSPSRVQDAYGPHDSSGRIQRVAVSDGVHSGRRCDPTDRAGSFRPNAPPRHLARDSRRRSVAGSTSGIERQPGPPIRISHPGRRSETWEPARMETPPATAERSTYWSDGL